MTIPSPIMKPTTEFIWRGGGPGGGPGGGRSARTELGMAWAMVADTTAVRDSTAVDATSLSDMDAKDVSSDMECNGLRATKTVVVAATRPKVLAWQGEPDGGSSEFAKLRRAYVRKRCKRKRGWIPALASSHLPLLER